jgi:hypothetical protein
MQKTRDRAGTVEVDGDIYEWEIRRQPRPLADGGWDGMAVSLRLKDFPREAVVMFPMPMRPNGRPDMEMQLINPESVRNAVVSVIAAGWNPTSRGKSTMFDVDADGH